MSFASSERTGSTPCRIVVLGVGNLLLRDEGFGVHVVRRLLEGWTFPDNVEIIDGGTAGMALLDAVSRSDRLIIVDVMRAGLVPGTLSRMDATGGWPLRDKQSAHDWGVMEVLMHASLIGVAPTAVVIAAEPRDISDMGLSLSPPLVQALPAAVHAVLAEVEAAGACARARPGPVDPVAPVGS